MNTEFLSRATLYLFLMAFFVTLFMARNDFDTATGDPAMKSQFYARLF
ncbi:hypothetical protein [Brucella sp. IR073]